jgi:hypothetical protein
MENRRYLEPQLTMDRLLYLSLYVQINTGRTSLLGSHAHFQSSRYFGTTSHEPRTLMGEQAKCSGKNFSVTEAFFPSNASIYVARIARIMSWLLYKLMIHSYTKCQSAQVWENLNELNVTSKFLIADIFVNIWDLRFWNRWLKTAVFCGVAPCGLVDGYQRFEGKYCLLFRCRNVDNDLTKLENITCHRTMILKYVTCPVHIYSTYTYSWFQTLSSLEPLIYG